MTVIPLMPAPNAALLLADGTVFFGYGLGAAGAVSGEICFNTAMTGYQEILTDPSYAGQIITFTFPHIGNVGCNGEDVESGEGVASGQGSGVSKEKFLETRNLQSAIGAPPGACGLIVREPITAPSNFRAAESLDSWLKARGITGISGVDTRALTRHIRKTGAQNCAIVVASHQLPVTREELLKKAQAALELAPDMNGLELAAHVTTQAPYAWTQQRWELGAGYLEQTPELAVSTRSPQGEPLGEHGSTGGKPPSEKLHVVAIDYGVKRNILRSLASQGLRLTVVPATATAEEILALGPDGVFLSNGPGDPAATGNYAVPVIKKLLAANLPIFGICLGHQMLGIALGCRTEKMRQGHRGANHPVKDLQTSKVEITSQNHGFAISDQFLPEEVEVTHRSLFDQTIQGIRLKGKPVFSVQGHPEASPGPQDSQYLFARFVEMIQQNQREAV